MGFVSYGFPLLVGGLLLVYYLLPRERRWWTLLAGSWGFYALCGLRYVPFLAFVTGSVYLGARGIRALEEKRKGLLAAHPDYTKGEKKALKAAFGRKKRGVFLLALLLNLGLLGGCKYLGLFEALSPGELLPLGMLSFTIAFIAGLYRLRLAPLLRQPARLILTVVNTLLYSAITAFMAVSAVMMLPYVIPDPSAKLEVGVLIMVTLCGVQLYVFLASRLTGIPPEKIGGMLMTKEFLAEVRDGMTPEQCREHADLCPFRQEHEERIRTEKEQGQ